ncbi:MAG: holdfast anchoring protein HfaA [Rhizomicrobium sp.]
MLYAMIAMSKTFAAALLASCALAGAAQAGDFSNASTYNSPFGLQAGQENQAVAPSLRDGNGNLTAINGQITSGTIGAGASASGAASAHSGVGTGGAGSAFGSATAIGNQLNVVTLGNNNTVVVTSTQTNNGNQTAVNTVNGKTATNTGN